MVALHGKPLAPGTDMHAIVGTHDLLWVTLDTLRYDVARDAMDQGRTPGLRSLIPGSAWEKRHTPGNFTYAAHHAFFAGFLPTPVAPGRHVRRFASRFEGAETVDAGTFVYNEAALPPALSARGYHTVCIGGVGFFNKRTALGGVLPSLFDESHWAPEFGVTDPRSTENQVERALLVLGERDPNQRIFLFLNVSAIHQPNRIFAPTATEDDIGTMAAALAHVDGHLERLIGEMACRAPLYVMLTSDHGTAYGEDGYTGHRVAHASVWDVPFAEFVLEQVNRR